MKQILVIGSRSFEGCDCIKRQLFEVLDLVADAKDDYSQIEGIISGHYKGIDKMVDEYCKKTGCGNISIPAMPESFGSVQTINKRNAYCIKTSDMIVCVWDGKCVLSHTYLMYEQAKNSGKNVILIRSEKNTELEDESCRKTTMEAHGRIALYHMRKFDDSKKGR